MLLEIMLQSSGVTPPSAGHGEEGIDCVDKR